MIFYRIDSNPPQIVATQVEARRAAKAEGVDWWKFDVPTEKAALMIFVNELLAAEPKPEAVPASASVAAATPIDEHAGPRQDAAFTASEIEDFILNRATVAQAENVFACLGTRFAEIAAQRRAA